MVLRFGGQSPCMAQLPTQSQFGDYSDWPGRDVLDSRGERLGSVHEIYLDRETGRPEWVLVDVEDSDARFVPLANADVDGWSIKVAHSADTIREAPGIGAEPRIDQSEERRLYSHYGLDHGAEATGTQTPRSDAPPAPTGWGQTEEPAWQARGSEVSNDAPPPADPPSPAELAKANIPEPPAATDRAVDYETAPFGAVAPPSRPTPSAFAPPVTADVPEAHRTPPGSPALTPHAGPPGPDPAAKAAWTSPSRTETAPVAGNALARVTRSPAKVALAAAGAAVLFFITRRLR